MSRKARDSRRGNLWVLLVVAVGCGGARAHPSPRIAPVAASARAATSATAATQPPEATPVPPQSLRVEGRVLALRSLSPLAGRIIVIGDQKTTTDQDGRFALDDVEPFYDLFISEPDRSTVSIYEGLSRRDPLVVHEPKLGSVRPGTASVYGTAVSQAPRTPFTPPSLLSPAANSVVTSAIRFSWTPCEHCVSCLRLSVNVPSQRNPDIFLYTSSTATSWPDLSKLGIDFPNGVAEYTLFLNGVGVPTMDDAVGPAGLAGPIQPFWNIAGRRGYLTLIVPRAPIPGAKGRSAEPPCDVPEGETVTCGKLPVPTIEHSNEWYQLSALNLKLRCYPDFAATVSIHCVRDCAGARAWFKAYEKYMRAHPSFDANQPLSCPPP
jgi:hypothetical protein